MFELDHELILASGSTIRQQLLKDMGLAFTVVKSSLDEGAYKQQLGHQEPEVLAMKLAEAKAFDVGKIHREKIIIGCDQICVCEGKIFQKPETIERSIQQLQRLSGKTHKLHSAVCLVTESTLLWSYTDTATLTMRCLNENEVRAYAEKDKPIHSCGSYYFESLGRHLFQAIEGCHDSILGLPLVPLLNELYHQKILR